MSYNAVRYVVEGIMAANIMLSYNSAVRRGTVYLDNSPLIRRKWGKRLHATARFGCCSCVQKGMSDAMDSIGGIKAIFPLLAQYDLPTGDDLDANLHWFESPQKNKLFF